MRILEPLDCPLVCLAALAVLVSTDAALLAGFGEVISRQTEFVWRLGSAYLVAWWVSRDRRTRSLAAPFEFDAFVFFAWFLVLPYYFVRTRGPQGLWVAFGFFLILLLPYFASGLTDALVGD